MYFLGSLLFEMLEGRRPFEVPELSGMSMAGEPIAPSLQAVISQCLKANPAHRYPSVEVLCAAVVEALAPESVVAPPRPRRTGWWVAIALLVVAGVGALFHAPLLAAITVEQAARKALVAAPAPPALEVAPAPEPVEQRPLPEGDLVIAGIVQRLSQQLAPSKKKPRRR